MARLTRRERSQDNERRLLDAAFEVFTTRGFHGGTLEQVAAAAGLTTGAVYSRYAGKAELLLALIERTIEERIDELRRLRESGETDVGTAWERAWWASVLGRPEWMLLVIEFRTHAARVPALNARYAELRERHVRALAETIEEDAARAGLVLTEPAGDLARIGMALAAGMALERWSMGDAFDADLPLRATKAMERSVVRPAGEPSGEGGAARGRRKRT
jgi:AcrR family transcriptional regulator